MIPRGATRVAELLELVGLPDAGALRPHELSGGMQQRVALARALAPRPEVILLDEPFANLDLSLRTQLRGELRRVLDVSGTSALLVTHDQGEALTVADRVAVMRRGRIDQVDAPEVIYAQPATPFVATFVGVANLVPGSASGSVADTPLGRVRIDPGPGGADPSRALVLIRPEHVEVAPAAAERPSSLIPARILARRFAGSELLYEVETDAGLRLWVEAGPSARLLRVGDQVGIGLRAESTVAFPSGA